MRRQRDGRDLATGAARAAPGPRPGGRGRAAVQRGGRPVRARRITTSWWQPTAPRRRSAPPSPTRSGPRSDVATAKFIWFGTDYLFDGLTFVHERGPHGVFAVHGYPISAEVSTFIVETDEASWRARRAGRVRRHPAAGTQRPADEGVPGGALRRADRRSLAAGQQLPVGQLPDPPLASMVGARAAAGRAARRCRAHRALLGGFRHEDGDGGRDRPDRGSRGPSRRPARRPGRLRAAARPSVEAIQDSARPSLAWWEHFGRYHDPSRRGSSPTTSCPAASPTPGSRAGTRSSSRPATSGGSPPTGPSRWRRR